MLGIVGRTVAIRKRPDPAVVLCGVPEHAVGRTVKHREEKEPDNQQFEEIRRHRRRAARCSGVNRSLTSLRFFERLRYEVDVR